MLQHLDHVNLVVADLPAMTAFYRDVIGLQVTRELTIDGPWIETLTGLTDAVGDVVYLEAPTGPPVELISYRTPQGTRPPGLGEANTLGLRHIAFRVDRIEEMVEAITAAGIKMLSEVQSVPTTQVEFGDRQKLIVYCRDPEGNLLELCEYRARG